MKDLIILGNGMAGMTAALYAKRANLDFKIVGKDEFDFGQIGNAILVENYPCAASQSGFDLAMKLHDQLVENGIEIEENEVKMVTNLPDGTFLIEYVGGYNEWAKSVIYALGARHRELKCEIKDEIPIHYCALCDGTLYKDKNVAIIGGGDVAFTQAEYLSKICERVFIVMCDDNITASPSTAERVKNIDNVFITYNFPVHKIKKHNRVSHYELISNDTNEFSFFVDGIFVAIGMIPNTQSIIITKPLVTNTLGYITTDENCKTACNGFFAAGDVRAKAVRQSITAAADGAIAVNSVINYLKRLA
jgi:thioredoxin reductase (NADPH)